MEFHSGTWLLRTMDVGLGAVPSAGLYLGPWTVLYAVAAIAYGMNVANTKTESLPLML